MTYIQPQCYVIISEELDRRLRMFYKSERQGSFFLGEIIIAPGTSGHIKKTRRFHAAVNVRMSPAARRLLLQLFKHRIIFTRRAVSLR